MTAEPSSEMFASPSKRRALARFLAVLIPIVFTAFYLMLALGAASIVDDCKSLACAQAAQSLLAFLAAGALGVSVYRLIRRRAVGYVLLVGTVPLLVLHVIVAILDPNESIFFLITTAIVPLGTVVLLLARRVLRT